jgi:hypothetical protein
MIESMILSPSCLMLGKENPYPLFMVFGKQIAIDGLFRIEPMSLRLSRPCLQNRTLKYPGARLELMVPLAKQFRSCVLSSSMLEIETELAYG